MLKCICGHAQNKHSGSDFDPHDEYPCTVKGCDCAGWYWEGHKKRTQQDNTADGEMDAELCWECHKKHPPHDECIRS